jgi:membrane protein DedA with SNARE-associated domain
MPRGTFFAANVATSLVWPVAMAALGYVGIRPFLD